MSDNKGGLSKAAARSRENFFRGPSPNVPRPTAQAPTGNPLATVTQEQADYVLARLTPWMNLARKVNSTPQGYTSIFDRVWTDNLWDNITPDDIQGGSFLGGTGNPVSNWWKDNVGDKLNAASTGATTFYDTVAWAGAGAMLAANPNYWANRGANDNLWQTATEVSPGQAFQGLVSPVQDALGEAVTGEAQGVYSSIPGFNIADRKQREDWFNLGPQSIGSGIADFTYSWFLDPFVVVGKGVKVARYGSEMLGIGGAIRNTNIARVVEEAGYDLDNYIKYVESGGEAGQMNAIGARAEGWAQKSYTELLEDDVISSSPVGQRMASIIDKINDPIDAALVQVAGAGNVRAAALLRQRAAAVHDAMANLSRYNAYERAALQSEPNGLITQPLLDDVLEMNTSGKAIFDDLIKRDKALAEAVGVLDETDSVFTRLGTRSVMGTRLQSAWTAGRANRDAYWSLRKGTGTPLEDGNVLTWSGRLPEQAAINIDRAVSEARIPAQMGTEMKASLAALDRGYVPPKEAPKFGSVPGVYERVYQLSADFRKVRVWSWINGQRGSGWLYLRGFEDYDSAGEIRAAVTDSRVIRKDGAFLNQLMSMWGKATTPEQAWQAVSRIETAAVRKIAAFYGVDPKVAEAVYKVVDKRRGALLDQARSRADKKYGVLPFADPDSGDLIALDPVMSSQLETVVPMLDFKLMEQTIKSLSKSHFRGVWTEIEDAALRAVMPGATDAGRAQTADRMSHLAYMFLDEVNSAWKAAVLLRLGYTQRNVFEGWLRTWAVLGTIPALRPDRVARGAYRTFWSNPRAVSRAKRAQFAQDAVSQEIENARRMREVLISRRDWEMNRTYTYRDARDQPVTGPFMFYASDPVERVTPAGRSGRVPLGARTADGSPFPGNMPHDPDPSPIAHLGRDEAYDEIVNGYAEKYGIDISGNPPDYDAVRIHMPRTEAIAHDYNALPDFDDSPEVYRAYDALIKETEDQYRYMTEDLGITVVVTKDDPYKSVAEMVEDVRVNKRLKVFATGTDESGSHPYLTNEQNDKFRAVHDFFGHALPGRGFDRHGEEAAWIAHSRMFGMDARRAMTTETRGQNSVVILEGEFPTQKFALLPDVWVKAPDQHWYGTIDPDPYSVVMQQQIDALTEQIDSLTDVFNHIGDIGRGSRKRFIGDDGAFKGEYGELRRASASNERTVRNFLSSQSARDREMQMSENSWVVTRPKDPSYFGELARVTDQFRADPLARKALEGESVEDMARWLATDSGREYARKMGLRTAGDRSDRIAMLYDMVDSYYPTPEARALAARVDVPPTEAEFRVALSGSKNLNPIHGREVLEATTKFVDPYHGFLQWAFKWLGSIPESSLVRQPFYAEVWNRETKALYAKAKAQGVDVNAEDTIRRIENAAHRRALKATNETLFTITRYSNPAAAMKFLSPFFAAWENSVRTWTGIVVKDPSVLARAGLLWSLPNQLGMVVDENGKPVKGDSFSFLSGSENQYIVLPKPMSDFIANNLSGGVPVKFPKGGFNVVAPGESPWFPGFGPGVIVPVGLVLRDKPDWQKTAKEILGEDVWRQVAPFGVVQGSPLDAFLPAAARKAYDLMRGYEDKEYLAAIDAITQSAMIDWYASGADPRNRPTVKEMRERAKEFYTFSMFASLTLPVSTTRISKYQVQLDAWRRIRDTPGLPYRTKVDMFLNQYGEQFVPLTVSTSKDPTGALDPTLETWTLMTDNADLVEVLSSELGPDAVGVLAATASDGVFDIGVYNYWLDNSMPATTEAWKRKSFPGEVMKDSDVALMRREYYAEKDKRDAALAKLGVTSMSSKAAIDSGIAAGWTAYQQEMADKYGEIWTAYGPDSWNSERQGKVLAGINKVLNTPEFMKEHGQSGVWRDIKVYMDERRAAKAAILNGAPSDAVKELWDEWKATYRFTSLKFADFYDQFLEFDDLTVEVR